MSQTIFISGIGGFGTSALAGLLFNLGFDVKGSDRVKSLNTRYLEDLGIKITYNQTKENITSLSPKPLAIVATNAMPDNAEELIAARELDIPILRYPEMLGILTRIFPTIGVAGTHGKTTTTSMTIHVLLKLGFDISAIVGGRMKILNNLGFRLSEKLDKGTLPHLRESIISMIIDRVGDSSSDTIKENATLPYLVIEADEYKDAFLNYEFEYLLVPAIDYDHPDYFKTKDQYFKSFCSAFNKVRKKVITYKVNENFNKVLDFCKNKSEIIEAQSYTPEATSLFSLLFLQQNASLVLALGKELGFSLEEVFKAFTGFENSARRFEIVKSDSQGHVVVNDYAHNPQKVEGALTAFMEGNFEGPYVIIFEPHQTLRTLTLLDDFIEVFRILSSDTEAKDITVFITDIFTAREGAEVVKKFNAQNLVAKLESAYPNLKVKYSPLERVKELLNDTFKKDILPYSILVMSAGKVGKFLAELAEAP